MFRTSIVSGLAAALVTVSLIAPARADFVEDFEGYAAGSAPAAPWSNGVPASTTLQVSTADAYSGSKSLYLADQSSTLNPSATRDNGSTADQGTLSWAYRQVTGGSARIDLFNSGSAGKNFDVLMDGQLYIRDGSSVIKSTASYAAAGFSTTDWNTLTLSFDNLAHEVKLYVNGNLAIDYTNPAITFSVGKISLVMGWSAATNMTGYFDSVSLTTVPEPASLGLLLPAAGLIRRRRSA